MKLSVTVNGAAGVLSGANVTYACGMVSGTASTGTDGIASVSSLVAGTYAITASYKGYTTGTASVVIGDTDVSLAITLVVSPTASVESAVEKAIDNASNSATTAAEDWKTISAAAEEAIATLVSASTSTDYTSTSALEQLYAYVTAAIKAATTKIEEYKSALMISRHSLSWIKCIHIDLKLAGITVFQIWASKKIASIQKTIESKIS